MALRRKHPGGQSEFFAGFSDVSSIDGGTSPSVYSATEAETGHTVALKVLDIGASPPRPSRPSGKRPSRCAPQSHPNIVTLFRAFSAPDGRPVLVMERCSESLADLVERDGAAWSRPRPWRSPSRSAVRSNRAPRRHAPPLHQAPKAVDHPRRPAGIGRRRGGPTPVGHRIERRSVWLHHRPCRARDARRRDGHGGNRRLRVGLDAVLPLGRAPGLRNLRRRDRRFGGPSILRDPVPPLLVDGVPMALSDLLVTAMTKEPTERPSSALAFAEALRSIERRSRGHRPLRRGRRVARLRIDPVGLDRSGGAPIWIRCLVPLALGQPARRAGRTGGKHHLCPPGAVRQAHQDPHRSQCARPGRPRFGQAHSPHPAPRTRSGGGPDLEGHAAGPHAQRLGPSPFAPGPSAGVPAPTMSPNTGRSTGSPDPSLALLSRSAAPPPPARVRGQLFRFAAAPSIKAVGAAATPHPPSCPDVPDAELLGPAPDPGLFGFPSPLAEVPSAPAHPRRVPLGAAPPPMPSDDRGPKSADPN